MIVLSSNCDINTAEGKKKVVYLLFYLSSQLFSVTILHFLAITPGKNSPVGNSKQRIT